MKLFCATLISRSLNIYSESERRFAILISKDWKKNLFGNPKDQTLSLVKSGIYKINYDYCIQKYYGRTLIESSLANTWLIRYELDKINQTFYKLEIIRC